MRLTRLVITCGGTGGHFYPGLSIAREFKASGGEVLLLLSGVNSVKQAEIAGSCGIDVQVLPDMPSPKKSPVKFLFGLTGGFFRSLKILRSFAPQAVLGMGSFAMLPVTTAAVVRRIPLALHDGNARIGRANRWVSRFAKVLGTAFPPVNASSCRCGVVETGMPVRPELLKFAAMTKAEAVAGINRVFNKNFSPERPTLLIFGGSQGAAVFNRTLPQALKVAGEEFQVLHLTGRGKLAETAEAYGGTDFPLLLLEGHEQMELFLGSADLVFSRSGGSTVAELALFGRAAVLVPFPFAAEGHQQDNGAFLADNDAACLVKNGDFTVGKAVEILRDFGAQPNLWMHRAEKAAALAKPCAARTMLKYISESAVK